MNKYDLTKKVMKDLRKNPNTKCSICGTSTESFLPDDNFGRDAVLNKSCIILGINPLQQEFNEKEAESLTYVMAGILSTCKLTYMCPSCLELIENSEGVTLIDKIINAVKSHVDQNKIETLENEPKEENNNTIPKDKINYDNLD